MRIKVGSHEVTYQITRAGQVPPCMGNQVQVMVQVTIPDSDELAFNAKFCGERLTMRHSSGGCSWGLYSRTGKTKVKKINGDFAADTWAEAFAKAEAYCQAEITKLRQLVVAREKALADAEDEEKRFRDHLRSALVLETRSAAEGEQQS